MRGFAKGVHMRVKGGGWIFSATKNMGVKIWGKNDNDVR